MNNEKTFTGIRVSLRNETINIPYLPDKDSEGEVFPYRNLIKNPDEIDHIPELEGEPLIKQFVARINAPEGLFETFRIIQWFDLKEGISRQSICLGFFFRDRSLFRRYDNCMMFLGNLLQRVEADSVSLPEPPLVEIQRAYLKTENIKGWVIDIYLSGFGTNKQLAREYLGTTLAKLDSFFLSGS